MGIIIGKLRSKKTTREVLEKLDKEIKNIEEYRRHTEQSQKKIVGRFVLVSVGVYVITAFLFYFYFFPATFYDRLFYVIPLLAAPVVIFSVKRTLSWYYARKISKKQNKLSKLRDERKDLLEKVMETETYKVAKEILEKYSPDYTRRPASVPLDSTPMKQPPPGLRQRTLASPQSVVSTPLSIRPSASRMQLAVTAPSTLGPPALPMPRAVLPRDRSVLDKMVEYLVGDGPSNRYALICKQCASHNGMALREEFEYVSFRCCYCYIFNPARKKRPLAPKLEFEVKPPSVETSESEKQSASDSETDSEQTHGRKVSEIRKIFDENKGSDQEKNSDFDKLSDLEHSEAPAVSVEAEESNINED